VVRLSPREIFYEPQITQITQIFFKGNKERYRAGKIDSESDSRFADSDREIMGKEVDPAHSEDNRDWSAGWKPSAPGLRCKQRTTPGLRAEARTPYGR